MHLARPVLVLLTLSIDAAAQTRAVEQHDFSDARGRLIGFYSAAITFTPVDAPVQEPAGVLRVGMEVSYIPRLSETQRRAGDKPEATNLAPLFPRPRAVFVLPGRLRMEASWIPPVALFGVRANIVSVALARPTAADRALTVTPRLAVTTGRAEGAITCYPDLQRQSPDLAEYYALVCHDRPSKDWFEPRQLTGELIAAWTRPRARLLPYLGAGLRGDRSRFDIGVIRSDGSRDPDHPLLDLRATRGYLFAGSRWVMGPRVHASAEVLYAPGSLLTARVQGSYDVRR